MAESPVDPVIAQVFGGQVITGSALSGSASHDCGGVRHVFAGGTPGWRYALDVERRDTALDPGMMAVLMRIADADPLQTWTLIEVAAKLLHHPAHLLLRRAQADGLAALLTAAGIETAQPSATDHLISVGRAPLSR